MNPLIEQMSYFRMKVDVFCPARNHHQTYETSKISMSGVAISGVPCISPGTLVEVTFGKLDGGALMIPCTVDSAELSEVYLRYRSADSMTMLQLHEVLWPEWDMDDLLGGLLILSRWNPDETLADWLRLTGRLVELRHGLCMARAQFQRAALAGSILPKPPHGRGDDILPEAC